MWYVYAPIMGRYEVFKRRESDHYELTFAAERYGPFDNFARAERYALGRNWQVYAIQKEDD